MLLLGTAGHVDHGKTSLVKALVGSSPSARLDRLPEERQRGITVDLGFAQLTLPSGRTVSVVDVPGHQRFVKTMAAGAGAVDLALLVIAADEGVMPQTKEHVDICSLLHVRGGIIVVTKSDLLPGLGDGWLDLLEADVRAAVAGSPFAEAPLVAVSAKTGDGLPALLEALDQQAALLETSDTDSHPKPVRPGGPTHRSSSEAPTRQTKTARPDATHDALPGRAARASEAKPSPTTSVARDGHQRRDAPARGTELVHGEKARSGTESALQRDRAVSPSPAIGEHLRTPAQLIHEEDAPAGTDSARQPGRAVSSSPTNSMARDGQQRNDALGEEARSSAVRSAPTASQHLDAPARATQRANDVVRLSGESSPTGVTVAVRRSDGTLFIPLDRAFLAKGFGLVATGTVWSGSLSVDDELTLLPSGKACRARSLQIHGTSQPTATVGNRVAINLPDLSLDDVARGHALVRRDALAPARVLDVELELLARVEAPLGRRSRHLITLGTAQLEAIVRLLDCDELRPGERCFAQLRFPAPIAALPGQRFIVRSSAGASDDTLATLGGGGVITLDPPRRRTGSAARVEQLAHAILDERLRLHLVEAGYRGIEQSALATRVGATAKELARAVELGSSRGEVVVLTTKADTSRRLVAGEVMRALEARALARLDVLHRSDAERTGWPREELRQRLGEPPERVFTRALELLLSRRQVALEGELVRLPGHGGQVSAAKEAVQSRLLATLTQRGLSPPTLYELTSTMKLAEAEVVRVGQALVAARLAIKAGELFFAKSVIDTLEARVRQHFATHEKLSTQTFKELTGLSRKYLIPLAEYFDREKLTLRVGDERVLRKPASP